MKKWFLLITSIIIDGLIPNITLYQLNNLSYFTSLFTVVSLIFMYDDKHFWKLLLVSSVLYGSLHMSNLLLSFVSFYVVLKSIKFLNKNLENNLFTTIIKVLLIILIYDGILFLIVSIISYDFFNIYNYFYKINHSIILNILYGIILFYFYKKVLK